MTLRESVSPRALSRSDLERRVADVVAEVGGCGAPASDAQLADLGFDSLALLDLLAVLEETFGIELTEDVITEFRTVAGVARVVRDAEPAETRS
ncbi:MAG: acyl carrier protein [Deltaproteobacteria bacterium]|nr:acyl carrier protein [Deltaproteobacteria bacterium]